MAESETRCVCGDNTDNEGFMICCETCEVWQHGGCIGIKPESTPDKYYCERCEPNNKIHIRRRKLMATIQAAKGAMVGSTSSLPPTAPAVGSQRSRVMAASAGLTNEISTREQRKLDKLMEQFQRIEDRHNKIQHDVVSGNNGNNNNNNNSLASRTGSNRASRQVSDNEGGGIDTQLDAEGDVKMADAAASVTVTGRNGKKVSARDARAKQRHVTRVVETQSTINRDKLRRSISSRRIVSKRKLVEIDPAKSLAEAQFLKRSRNPLTPCYLGHKQWLLATYLQNQEAQNMDLKGRILDTKTTSLVRRIQANYTLTQQQQQD